MQTEYRNTPGGLSGNDDAGSLSAWYVFACLGFYPVCPGSTEYALGIPAFDRIIIHQENGRDFTIRRRQCSKTAFRLGCRRLSRPFICHKDIVSGKNLTFDQNIKK